MRTACPSCVVSWADGRSAAWQENGVATAIQCIYRDMEYAKSLIKRKTGKNAQHDEDYDDDEESWTFIGGDEPDPDLTTKRLSDGLGGGGGGGSGSGSGGKGLGQGQGQGPTVGRPRATAPPAQAG
jgi:hypothetical protein